MKIKNFAVAALLLLLPMISAAQISSINNYVEVLIMPDHEDWVYEVGESVEFDLSVMKNNYAQQDIVVEYQWGEETLTPIVEAEFNTGKSGHKSLKLKGLSKPGFMTLMATVKINGKSYSNFINVAFEPDKIETVVNMPSDFDEFWSKTLAVSSNTPLDATMTLQPDQCTSTTDVYHVRFQNTPKTYMYGMLSVPKKEGVYPAVLILPGAGVRAYYGSDIFPKEGVISLSVGIHGIPVNMEAEVYSMLGSGPLLNYNCTNYDDRDKHYYKRVYTGCVKAVDFLSSLANVDPDRIGVLGGSQGGQLALVVGGLDQRVKCVVTNYPAYCNISGYARGSVGGWPKPFRNPDETNLDEKIRVSEYYDAVNFARRVTAPTRFATGYNDRVCIPTSSISAYNEITAPKQIHVTNVCGHWFFPEQTEEQRRWIVEQLKK